MDYYITCDNNTHMVEHFCRVCGLYNESPTWENNNIPSHNICPCCGVEFGYEDYSLDWAREYRQKWLQKGATWFNAKQKPSNWDLAQQMKNIPQKWL